MFWTRTLACTGVYWGNSEVGVPGTPVPPGKRGTRDEVDTGILLATGNPPATFTDYSMSYYDTSKFKGDRSFKRRLRHRSHFRAGG